MTRVWVALGWVLLAAACGDGPGTSRDVYSGEDGTAEVIPDGIPAGDGAGEDQAPGDDAAADHLPDPGADPGQPPECTEDLDCDNGDLCDGSERCLDSTCLPGAPVDCGLPGPCDEAVSCEPATGACMVSWKDEGAGCDDGRACNGLAECDGAGLCVPGVPVACEAAATCVEEDLSCACLPPAWVEAGACRGPALAATFEDVELGPDGAWTGGGEEPWVRSGTVRLHNHVDPVWSSWDGFAVSRGTDRETAGPENELSAIPGSGVHGSPTYAVGYDASGFGNAPPMLELLDAGEGAVLHGVFVANTTWTYLSMLHGDAFAKKFGGPDGADPDWLLLTISGLVSGGGEGGDVEVYLADFRSDLPAQDYILAGWTWVDLSPLGPVTGLRFTLSSSDSGEWGMNTPAYFALDDVNRREPLSSFGDLGLGPASVLDGSMTAGAFQSGNLRFMAGYTPDWGVWDGFAASTMADTGTPGPDNPYSAITGSGDGDTAFAVTYDGSLFGGEAPTIEVVGAPEAVASLSVTNTTWAFLSMMNGDDFAKKFGGPDGSDPDWFLLTIEGLDPQGGVSGTVEHWLADLRFPGASPDDMILDGWETVDLTSLGPVAGLRLVLTSSDTGEWGMNTPATVAVDEILLAD
ncbi:MAG: DUF4465 domain-containing protein [Deltaproteobacteria bacterium]|nr:DUF4465 domain-containing protein [Deltaproteobacteria bacterium]